MMMSLKRVVLMAAVAALVLPAAAFADGVTFQIIGNANQTWFLRPTSATTVVTNDPTVHAGTAPAQINWATRFTGSTPPGTPGSPSVGAPMPPYNLFNFGTATFTTALATGFTSTSVTFGAGGSIVLVANAAMASATGGVIPNGAPLFTGSFSGPTTLSQINFCTGTCNPATFNFHYNLTGPVSGVLDSSVLQYFNLGSSPGAAGFFFSTQLGFIGPSDPYGTVENGGLSVVVPEPGTLALFGTGLIGVAGFIRRRLKA
jgi:hypothetical protein